MPCSLLNLCQYETQKLVRIRSVKLGSLKWTLNGIILMFICIMLLWNKEYQEYDLVVSSVTTKVKGVAQTNISDMGEVVWDVVDHSGPSQGKNSFFVATNVIVTRNQKQGKCPEVLHYGKQCHTDKDCEKGYSDQHSHGVQTGACVKADILKKTCEVAAWCPIENKKKPPRDALLASAENFTVLIKNNIRFPAFNYIRRNILPEMTDTYLKKCIYNRRTDPYCPIFRLGDIVHEARENFSDMAIEGGVIGIQINWDCDLNYLINKCLPKYSFRRLDEKESNRTLYPGLNFRFGRYFTVNGVDHRTLFKVYGIRFDVMVFGKAGKFSIIQLVIYIGSTLSYYALTTILIDWLIGTSFYSREARQNFSEKKFESVQDKQECLFCVSFLDENQIRVVKRSRKKRLQEVRALSLHPCKDDSAGLRALLSVLQSSDVANAPSQNGQSGRKVEERRSAEVSLTEMPRPGCPEWCVCGSCRPSSSLLEQLCCRRGRGRCIASSPFFPRLVVNRFVLETMLLYVDPLAELREGTQLRHGAYAQYIRWRFGDTTPREAIPVIPSCCVRRIREEYPSSDGKYSGLSYSGPSLSSSNT
ncbi:P2X purinoceptor 7 [Chanos chanos]|uniref:P2X purinoceptor n=1 Tax=Chanos chanos TaxID=29144 RepID=A0A6J2UPD4_CHACN|nr:P2X purinoceptor 7 [Chanos chanos]